MADIVDESEFWISDDDDEENAAAGSANATLFQLGLEQIGQKGGMWFLPLPS